LGKVELLAKETEAAGEARQKAEDEVFGEIRFETADVKNGKAGKESKAGKKESKAERKKQRKLEQEANKSAGREEKVAAEREEKQAAENAKQMRHQAELKAELAAKKLAAQEEARQAAQEAAANGGIKFERAKKRHSAEKKESKAERQKRRKQEKAAEAAEAAEEAEEAATAFEDGVQEGRRMAAEKAERKRHQAQLKAKLAANEEAERADKAGNKGNKTGIKENARVWPRPTGAREIFAPVDAEEEQTEIRGGSRMGVGKVKGESKGKAKAAGKKLPSPADVKEQTEMRAGDAGQGEAKAMGADAAAQKKRRPWLGAAPTAAEEAAAQRFMARSSYIDKEVERARGAKPTGGATGPLPGPPAAEEDPALLARLEKAAAKAREALTRSAEGMDPVERKKWQHIIDLAENRKGRQKEVKVAQGKKEGKAEGTSSVDEDDLAAVRAKAEAADPAQKECADAFADEPKKQRVGKPKGGQCGCNCAKLEAQLATAQRDARTFRAETEQAQANAEEAGRVAKVRVDAPQSLELRIADRPSHSTMRLLASSSNIAYTHCSKIQRCPAQDAIRTILSEAKRKMAEGAREIKRKDELIATLTAQLKHGADI
jgi:hypothetical protein